MTKYFDLLEEVYNELDFKDHPERIYDMDETGMPLDPRPPKVVVPKGRKKVRYRCSGQKSQIIVIGCGNATGQTIPPYIIFGAKQLNSLWMKDEVPGSRYALSDNAWIDQELFHFWMTEHFLNHAVAARPLLLLLDGHSSHFKLETIRFAQEHGIVVFCLPPHTTNECQPLDCSFFGPLKVHWRDVTHSFHQKYPTAVISKLNFNRLFKEAWLRAVTPQVLASGFRKSGVYPLNCARISTPKEHVDGDGDGDGANSSSTKNGGGSPSNTDGESSDPSSPTDAGSSSTDDTSLSGGDGKSLTTKSCTNGNSVSSDMKELYERRYEEGYDIFDPDYAHWLHQRHPEALVNYFASPMVSNSKASTPQSTPLSDPSGSASSSLTSKSNARSLLPTPLADITNKHDNCSTPGIQLTTPRSDQSKKSSPQSSSSTGSIVSQFLGGVPVKTVTPSRPPDSKSSGARFLTKAECIAILEEKQEKKKEKEEKEQRKLMRELNRKKREEEQKKKAEKRAKKLARKQADRERKEAEKAAKQAEKQAAKTTGEGSTRVSQKRPASSRSDPAHDRSTRPKAPKLSSPEHINPNQCCACFGLYEDDIGTGVEWLQRTCTRWIHEECVDNVVRSEDGEEKLCPLCYLDISDL